jgi:hypothetical protein
VTGRRGRRRRKLLEDLKENIGYCHLNEEALDRTVWRAGFARVFGPVVRQTAKWVVPVLIADAQGMVETLRSSYVLILKSL